MPSLEMGRPYPVTPDGRYFVVRGRLWRCTNPALSDDERKRLTSILMAARRHVGRARRQNDIMGLVTAHEAVDAAKTALGERGQVWWDDGAPDCNRKMARNSIYATWYVAIKKGGPDPCPDGEPSLKTPRKTMAELSAASRSSDPAAVKQAPVDRLSVDQAPRHDVTPTITTRRARGRISVDGKRTVVRREKPHTSIYMHPAAMRTLRGIAAAEDCKPHDVLLEGLRMVFARFGYDFDQLDRGD